jgi:hypothetical protein
MDWQKDPAKINGPMTGALVAYSGLFIRWSIAISPPNYALCACHVVNFAAQSYHGFRAGQHSIMGGKVTSEAKEE